MKHVHSTDDAELDRGPFVALAEEKSILPLVTINQSKMCKENKNLPCLALF